MIINSVPNPSPLPGEEWVGLKVSNHGFVFLMTSLHSEAVQEPSKSHLIRTKYSPITPKIPKYLGALCQKPNPSEQKMLLAPLSLGYFKGFVWELWPGV